MKPDARLAEIDARRAAIKAEVEALDSIEAPTDEDAVRAASLADEFAALEAERPEVAERAAKLDAVRTAAVDPVNVEPVSRRSAPAVHVRSNPFEGAADAVRGRSLDDEEITARAITAMTEVSYGSFSGMTDAIRSAVIETIETVPGAGAYVLGHASPEYRSAFVKWMAAGSMADFTPAERSAMSEANAIRTALNITTGASGQFSLPTQFDPTLIRTGNAAINPIRSVARVESGTQNVWNGVSSGNVTTYWHAEAAALTDGAPTLARPIVTAGHLTAWVPMSWEFFDDSSVVGQLPSLIGEAFDFAEATAFISGSGTSQPLGVVTAISATAGSTVTATTRGTFTSASAVDVFRVANALPSRYENTSTWAANKATFNTVRQMSSAGYGSLFWGNLIDSVAPNPAYPLLGYPTMNCSDILSTTTTGTVLAVLGDFSQYLIYDRLGSTVERIDNIVNSSGIPTGQRGIAVRKRLGANVTDLNAFRFLLA